MLSEARAWAHVNRLTAKRGGDSSGCAWTVPMFAEVSAKVDQRGPVVRPDPRDAATDPGAVRGASHGSTPVDQVDRAAVLGRVYRDKPATGKLLRGWVRGVPAAAQALGHVDVERGGRSDRRGIAEDPGDREHRRGCQTRTFSRRWRRLRSGAGPVVKAAIRFTVLAAVRTGEARGPPSTLRLRLARRLAARPRRSSAGSEVHALQSRACPYRSDSIGLAAGATLEARRPPERRVPPEEGRFWGGGFVGDGPAAGASQTAPLGRTGG